MRILNYILNQSRITIIRKPVLNSHLRSVTAGLIVATSVLFGDWHYAGLRGRQVNTLEISTQTIYAGTNRGIFMKDLSISDTTWISLGLSQNSISTLLVLNSDTILAGVDVTGQAIDTATAIFRTTDGGTTWHHFQNGFGGDLGLPDVLTLHAQPGSPQNLFATGFMQVAKSTDGGLNWRLVWGEWDWLGMGTHFLSFNPGSPQTMWAGGESGVLFPYLVKSTDYGESWQFLNIDGGGDNACYSMAIDPLNSDVLYVGMEGRIIKTTNGGIDWSTVFMPDSYPYFFGLAISSYNSTRVYAAGAVHTDSPQDIILYYSNNGGDSWSTYVKASSGHGTSSMIHNEESGQDVLYFGTYSDGIYRFNASVLDLQDGFEELPRQFDFHPAYPNPFNPVTTMRFDLPQASEASLIVYDITGRQVAQLANGYLEPGQHQVQWDGQGFPSGIYIARLMTLEYTKSIKMVLLK
ncbi:T9SS type A sorting domain-containing protein [Candidatus Neomarinimicrobiota bacterium]